MMIEKYYENLNKMEISIKIIELGGVEYKF